MKTLLEYLKQDCDKNMRWLRAHPLKGCLFSAALGYFVATTALMFAYETQCACRWIAIGFLAATFVTWQTVFHLDLKKLSTVLVVAALLAAPASLRAGEPQPAPIIGRAVAVAVIAGGTWATYHIVKFCKRHFGKEQNTNAPPEEFVVAGPGEYGAAFSWTEDGYCQAKRQSQHTPPVGLTISITVQSASKATLTARGGAGPQFIQDLPALQAQLAAHGLPLFATAGQTEDYERDRQPCDPEQVPLSIDWATKTIRHGAGGVLVQVEQSIDLVTWQPLAQLNVVPGSTLNVEDASDDGMQFYRVHVSEP